MDQYKISVIMPAYNEEKFLAEAIESVICQTYQNWELVVVDDGSKDCTRTIMKAYEEKDDRIRCIYKDENEGQIKALNSALEKTTGDYVCWLSADDKYMEYMFQSQLEFLENHPDVQVVFGKHRHVDKDGKLIAVFEPSAYYDVGKPGYVEPYRTIFIKGNPFCISTMLIPSSLFSEIGGFHEWHPYAGDYDMISRIAAHANLGFNNKIVMDSRIHEDQETNKGNNEVDSLGVFYDIIRERKIRKKLMKKAGLTENRKDILCGFFYRDRTYEEFHMHREHLKCQEYEKKFLEEDPDILKSDEYCRDIANEINMCHMDVAADKMNHADSRILAYADMEVWNILYASILEGEGKIKEESEVLLKLLAVNPKNCEANFMMAMIYEKLEMRKEAYKSYISAAMYCDDEHDEENIKDRLRNFLNSVM